MNSPFSDLGISRRPSENERPHRRAGTGWKLVLLHRSCLGRQTQNRWTRLPPRFTLRSNQPFMSSTGTQPDPDVLIIGAGPTGAVAARRFAEAGMSVVVLEQGDWPDYSKARAGHPDFELTAGRYWSGNPNRRQA